MVFVLMAGDAIKGSQLSRHLQSKFAAARPTVDQVAQAAGQIYHSMRLSVVDHEIMQPRGLSLQAFNQGQQHQLLAQLAFKLAEDVAGFHMGVDLIIAGIDAGGAHIATVSNPGLKVDDHEQIGFVSIGSGAIHAMQALIGAGHTKYRSLEETVFNTYAAKRRAEVAPGVGNDTDMIVVTATGARQLSSEDMKVLAEVYAESTQPVHGALMERVRSLDLQPTTEPTDNPIDVSGDTEPEKTEGTTE